MNRILVTFVFRLFRLISSNSQKMKIDLIASKATGYIVDDAFSVTESFAVKDGKLTAAGTNSNSAAQYVSRCGL